LDGRIARIGLAVPKMLGVETPPHPPPIMCLRRRPARARQHRQKATGIG
jgi:hypothetical protein